MYIFYLVTFYYIYIISYLSFDQYGIFTMELRLISDLNSDNNPKSHMKNNHILSKVIFTLFVIFFLIFYVSIFFDAVPIK